MSKRGKPFLSRHFLASRSSCLGIIPFAPAGHPDPEYGISVTHNLLSMAGWNDDAQEYQLSISDLVVGYTSNDVHEKFGATHLNLLASFSLAAAPTALRVGKTSSDGSSVMVVVGMKDGSLSRLRLHVPLIPGSLPSSIQLKEEDFDGAALAPWIQSQFHQIIETRQPDAMDIPTASAAAGPITGIDVSTSATSGCDTLMASIDGTLALVRSDDTSSSARVHLLHQSEQRAYHSLAFTSCAWMSQHVCATTSLQGVVHVWDVRSSSPCVHRRCLPPVQRDAILSLAVHPARPHSCAVGDARGSIVLWDFRAHDTHAAAHCIIGSAAIASLLYTDPTPGLLYSTDRGTIGLVSGDGTTPMKNIYEEPGASIEAMSVSSAGAASQLFATTDQEALIFMANSIE